MQHVGSNSGWEMPILGFGVYRIPDHEKYEWSVLGCFADWLSAVRQKFTNGLKRKAIDNASGRRAE